MSTKRGVYGTDDVPWEVEAGRIAEAEDHYRRHKEEIDQRDRLAIKRDLLARHEADGYIYQDAENQLYLGFERAGDVLTFGFLNLKAQFIHFTPLAKAEKPLVRWAPISMVKTQLAEFTMIAPKGCV